MEIIAERGDLPVAYGIATNYSGRSDDSVHESQAFPDTDEHEYPTEGSLKTITGEIYALLSDD